MKPVFNWNKDLVLIPASLALAVTAFSIRDDPAAPKESSVQKNPDSRRVTRAPLDFWNSAVVSDLGEPVPITAIRPEDLGIRPSTSPADPQALIAKAISENDLPAIQSAALSWFQQDPIAARDWLATQSTLDDLQPAISYIASSISEKGNLKTAIEWAKILPEGTLREDTLFNMHALALRNRQITFSEINLEGFSPERLQELQSGAAGD